MADRHRCKGYLDLACNRGAQFHVFDHEGRAKCVGDGSFDKGQGKVLSRGYEIWFQFARKRGLCKQGSDLKMVPLRHLSAPGPQQEQHQCRNSRDHPGP